jgi:hypothetical protein
MPEQIKERLAYLTPLREFATHYRWVHTTVGLLGGASFFVGSVFFLWEATKAAGIWLFILGSFGMLVDAVGQALIKMEGW